VCSGNIPVGLGFALTSEARPCRAVVFFIITCYLFFRKTLYYITKYYYVHVRNQQTYYLAKMPGKNFYFSKN